MSEPTPLLNSMSDTIPPPVPKQKGKGTKGSKALWIIGLSVGAVMLAIVSFAILVWLWIFTAKDQPITDGDRQLVAQVEEIAAYYDDFEPSQQYVSFTKERYLDGSVEIAYEYDSPREAEPYIAVTISHEISRSDAEMVYGLEWSGMRLGLNLYDRQFELREHKGFYKAGDVSRFGDIVLDGETLGHVLVSRKGNSVYAFTISGYIMTDPEIWREIFDERISQLADGD